MKSLLHWAANFDRRGHPNRGGGGGRFGCRWTRENGGADFQIRLGQFAEHLGRSIYGGLWAVMVEDRKFAHEITDEYNPFALANDSYGNPAPVTYLKNSPWKVIGSRGTVTMAKAGAHVGEWSPVVHLSQGNAPYNGAAGFLAVERELPRSRS